MSNDKPNVYINPNAPSFIKDILGGFAEEHGVDPITSSKEAELRFGKTPDILAIKASLDVLITAAEAHSALMRHRNRQVIAKATANNADIDDTTSEESVVNLIIKDPIDGALGMAFRKLGERLFRLGGADLIQEVYDHFEDDTHRNYHLLRFWRGIGWVS